MNVLIRVLLLFKIILLVSGSRCARDHNAARRSNIHSEKVETSTNTSANYTNFNPTKHPNWQLFDHTICGNSLADRIIGGINATLGQYPWIARIGYNSTINVTAKPVFRCGASLINANYVLTAAHCVTNLPNQLKVAIVKLGEFDITKNIDCEFGECADKPQDIKPSEILVHHKYGSPPFQNDIALIRLQKPAKFTKWVLPVCLPHGALMAKSFLSEFGEVIGWGYFDISKSVGSDVLQTVKLPVINNTRCRRAFRTIRISDEKQMCVGGEKGKDSCNGDSGGPMLKAEVVNGPPRYYQIAVVSFGARNCGGTSTPGVYTRVVYYMSWILDNIKTR
ncbi:Melanization Protease 1 [Carabus blaptoides fortunei]